MFDVNKKETYERIRNLKETQVQVLATQVDAIKRITEKSFSEDADNVYALKQMVENINEQQGVYCYLFDDDCNLLSDFSNQHRYTTGEKLIEALKEDNLKKIVTYEYHGYVEVIPSSGENMLVYWQGVPSGLRNECEYFIILSVSEREIQDNEAINLCKIMIGILTIMLGISLYGNLYVRPFLEDEMKEDDKQNKEV